MILSKTKSFCGTETLIANASVKAPPMVGPTWTRVRLTLGSDCFPTLFQGTALSLPQSQFTRNAADHARGRAPTHCFAPRLLDHAEGAREFVIKLSVVSTRLSMRLMNLDFSEDGHSHQLVSLKVWKKKCIYQTQSEQAHLLALYEICGDMILRTMCTPWPELEVHYWNCRNELERRSHQIW